MTINRRFVVIFSFTNILH